VSLTAAANRPHCPSFRWHTTEYGAAVIVTAENRRTRRKTCPSATFSTTHPRWTDLGTNPGRRGEKPATKRPVLWHGLLGHLTLLYSYLDCKTFWNAFVPFSFPVILVQFLQIQVHYRYHTPVIFLQIQVHYRYHTPVIFFRISFNRLCTSSKKVHQQLRPSWDLYVNNVTEQWALFFFKFSYVTHNRSNWIGRPSHQTHIRLTIFYVDPQWQNSSESA
jgi:hypothetical protein